MQDSIKQKKIRFGSAMTGGSYGGKENKHF